MDPAVYARGVVDNALKEMSELWYWRGAKIWVVWAMTTLLWHRFPVRSPIVFHLVAFFRFETEQGFERFADGVFRIPHSRNRVD